MIKSKSHIRKSNSALNYIDNHLTPQPQALPPFIVMAISNKAAPASFLCVDVDHTN